MLKEGLDRREQEVRLAEANQWSIAFVIIRNMPTNSKQKREIHQRVE